MAKPTDDIEFATDGGALVADPGSSKKKAGFDVDEAPPAHWFDWLFRAYWRWKAWIVDELFAADAQNTVSMTGLSGATRATFAALGGNGQAGIYGEGSGTNAGVIGVGKAGQNANGVYGEGKGTGNGVVGVATGNGGKGVTATGNGSGSGLVATGGTTASYSIQALPGGTNNSGVYGEGAGTGKGVYGQAGTSGAGIFGQGLASTAVAGDFACIDGRTMRLTQSRLGLKPVQAIFHMEPGPEPSGPNLVGDMYMTTAGVLKVCTTAGTPGTWTTVGTQT